MKHKHAELIKAWADGAEIQSRNIGEYWADNQRPIWAEDTEYRIKPKPPVVRWKWAYWCDSNDSWIELQWFMDDEECKEHSKLSNRNYIKLEYTQTEFSE